MKQATIIKMVQVADEDQPQRMTSLEIAELTGKQHFRWKPSGRWNQRGRK